MTCGLPFASPREFDRKLLFNCNMIFSSITSAIFSYVFYERVSLALFFEAFQSTGYAKLQLLNTVSKILSKFFPALRFLRPHCNC